MNKELTVILPTYNEINSIQKVVTEWKKELRRLNIKHEIIIAEDGSSDGTQKLLYKIKNKYKLRILSSKYRLGYGVAIIRAIRKAKAEWILSVDSDGQYDPKDLASFWGMRQYSSIIIGDRMSRKDPMIRIITSSIFRVFFNFVFPTNKIHDPSCPFVLYKKKDVLHFLEQLRDIKEPFWWMFVALCNLYEVRIRQIPINHKKRLSGETKSYKIRMFPRIFMTSLARLIKLRLQ